MIDLALPDDASVLWRGRRWSVFLTMVNGATSSAKVTELRLFDLKSALQQTWLELTSSLGLSGVEFGETSLEALKREFQEEIQAELTNIRYLGCLENIFTFNGQPGHEIIQLFESDFVDAKFYETEKLVFSEGERQKTALWVDINRFLSGELRLVPDQFLDYLSSRAE